MDGTLDNDSTFIFLYLLSGQEVVFLPGCACAAKKRGKKEEGGLAEGGCLALPCIGAAKIT